MIEVYTDGSCHVSNPGPAGAGFVIVQDYQEIYRQSISLGIRSNNFAELTAISAAIKELKERNLLKDIVIITDSQYCIGVLSQDWKPKANIDLIKKIKSKLLDFENLTFKWVRGHDGNHFNEIADQLANQGSDGSVAKFDSKKEVEEILVELLLKPEYIEILSKCISPEWVEQARDFLRKSNDIERKVE